VAKKKSKINIGSLVGSFNKTQQNQSKKAEESKRKREQEKREKKALEEKQKQEQKEREEAEQLARVKAKKKEQEANELQTFKIKLTTLSPVHIGTGDEYEPTNYVIKDDRLYSFNEHVVIEKLYERDGSLPTDDKLSDMYALVAFFRKEADFIIENNLYINSVSVSKDISKLYSKDFGISNNSDESMNQMLILKQMSTYNPYSENFEPYIAGSSIKGALQSVLELSVEESQKLKVSDAIGLEVKNHIAWAVRKTSKGSIPQKLEIISKGSTFELFLTKINALSIEQLKEKLDSFYTDADVGLFSNYSKNLKSNEGLLRVGRYCGKEFIVQGLSEKEKPKTKSLFRMSEKGARVDEASFGWIKWEVVEYDSTKKDKKLEKKDLSLEEEIKELIDNNPNPNDTDDIVLFNAIKKGQFDKSKLEALEILKEKMQKLGKWIETSKKPTKDKKYKRTLEVIEMIKV
jgi:CRISPR/Cas system CMR subunit Cmr6 (Cas7 group RAMP superfamily)